MFRARCQRWHPEKRGAWRLRLGSRVRPDLGRAHEGARGALRADMLVSRSGHARDLECRWRGAAMVLAPLQSTRSVRPRGPPRMAAAPLTPRSRAADRAVRAAARTRGTCGDPGDAGAIH